MASGSGSSGMRKAEFSKLRDLETHSRGVNLVVAVLSKEVAVDRVEAGGVNLVLEECVVGDETGRIIFTARNTQCQDMIIGNTVELRNARVNLHNGYMRVVVDKWGLIETSTDKFIDPESIPDHNFSNTQYE